MVSEPSVIERLAAVIWGLNLDRDAHSIAADLAPIVVELAAADALLPRCLDAYPAYRLDVEPIRCQRSEGHPPGVHWHPPVWPGSPPLTWPTA